MAEHETIADIIAAKRRLAAEMEKALGDQHTSVEMLKDDADRIEAAYRREKVAIEADALAVGGIVEAARKRERGDCAKLREVVDAMMYEAFALCDSCVKPAAERGKLLAKWCNKLRAALAATEKEGGNNGK